MFGKTRTPSLIDICIFFRDVFRIEEPHRDLQKKTLPYWKCFLGMWMWQRSKELAPPLQQLCLPFLVWQMRVCMILSIQEWNPVILDVVDLVSGLCDSVVDRKKKHFRQSSWKDRSEEDQEWLILSRKRRQVVSDPDMATCKYPITLRDWAALVSGDLLASITKLVLNICDYGSPMWQRV